MNITGKNFVPFRQASPDLIYINQWVITPEGKVGQFVDETPQGITVKWYDGMKETGVNPEKLYIMVNND